MAKQKKDPERCIMWKNGKCNSDYARGLSCDAKGGKNLPEGCPYSEEKLKSLNWKKRGELIDAMKTKFKKNQVKEEEII